MGSMTSPASPISREVLARVDDLVRKVDEERWLSSRYASADKRDTLMALYAFNYELARVRVQVNEAGLAAIRFQWWRDALNGEYDGKGIDTVDAVRACLGQGGLRASDLNILIDRHENAYDQKDRALEPERRLTRLAAYILAPSHGWGQGIEALASHWAALRRGETVGPGPIVEKVPPGIRPAIAHFRLRHAWAKDEKRSGRLFVRWTILRGVMTGRV
jgi:phytoene synthase